MRRIWMCLNTFKLPFLKIQSFHADHYIIAGDLNLALNVDIDKQGAATSSNNRYSAEFLNKFINNNDFYDIWREFYPDKMGLLGEG